MDSMESMESMESTESYNPGQYLTSDIGDPIGESIQKKTKNLGFGVREGSKWIDLAIPYRTVVVRGHQLRRRSVSGPK